MLVPQQYLKCTLVLGIIFLLFSTNSKAQSGFNLEANWLSSIKSDQIENWNQTASHNEVNGYRLMLTYSYLFKKYDIEARIGGGFKQLEANGVSGNTNFSSETNKVVLVAGIDYQVLKKLKFGLDFITENNRDFEDFRTSTTDLLRYDLQLRTNYTVYKGLSAFIYYSKVIYPNVDLYFLTNPDHQFGLGLHLNFLRL